MMKNKIKLYLIISLPALFITLFSIALAFPQGFLQGGRLDYFVTLILSFALFFWGMTLVYRVQYSRQRKILLIIFIIAFLWIVLRFVKWLANIHFVSIYADYFYYVPMTVIPLLLFMLIVETFCPKLSYKKAIYITLATIVLIFILLASTNDLHNLIYSDIKSYFPTDNPQIEIISYNYGILHFVMLGFVSLLSILTIILFFWGAGKYITFSQVFASSLLLVLLFAYIALYTFDIYFIKNIILLKDFALVIVILLTAIIETLLDVGLIQNNGRYIENFKNSNLPMCIYDEKGKKLFVSEKFSEQKNKNLKEKSLKIGSYTLVLQEDLTEIELLKEKISSETKELTETNTMLEKLIKVNAEKSSLSHRLAFADEIEKSIENSKSELENLIFLLPDNITSNNQTETKQILGRLALLLGYMKQKCMLLIGSKERSHLTYDAFKLIMQVISKDIQSVGFENIGVNIEKITQISFNFALLVNDFLNLVAKTYAYCGLDALIFVSPKNQTCVIELDGNNLEIKKLSIDGLNIKVTKGDDSIRVFMGVQDE